MKSFDALSSYVIAPAALLYFIGWIYLSTICAYTGLDVAVLGLDTHAILMNAYNVLSFVYAFLNAHWAWLPFTLVLAASLSATLGEESRKAIRKMIEALETHSVTRVVLYAAILVALAAVSRAAAQNFLAELTRHPGARMMFDFKKSYIDESKADCARDSNCYYPFLERANDAARLRMLMETPEYFVVWAQPLDETVSSIGQVYLLKKENVVLAGALDVETCAFKGGSSCPMVK